MINLTTGPVKITDEVIAALNSPVISHRSEEFMHIFKQVEQELCSQLQVQKAFILAGSGTLANDAMLVQVKAKGKKGLVLVNGEFGERLKHQASRLNINYACLEKNWGETFDIDEIKAAIILHNAQWLLLCHCETSTGQTVDIEQVAGLCQSMGVEVYLDCMSSFGTMPLNLENIAMATGSTAKAIGMVAGLALVFSNTTILPAGNVPVYLDLHHYQQCKGVPFTISSNLVTGLLSALNIEKQQFAWHNFKVNAKLIYQRLRPAGLIPFANTNTLIFTLVLKKQSAFELGKVLESNGMYTSFQSNYLRQRNWLQVALFSTYEEPEVEQLLDMIVGFLRNN
ncbi:aminotransferase class V-fold PLP-dependent enzyme [Ferruginibacter sp. SUN106]|uniref:aminotransferase class V-fold PLP-dependent enzyme n=1 Tax=Ferruginibacter sp. SUN106 TaxID=2978348 RepID=UPI003D367122